MSQHLLRRLRRAAGVRGPDAAADDVVPVIPSPTPDQLEPDYEGPEYYYYYYEDYEDHTGGEVTTEAPHANAIKKLVEQMGDKMKGMRQSCPWVGLTHGLDWAGLGWVGSTTAKILKFERISLLHLKHG